LIYFQILKKSLSLVFISIFDLFFDFEGVFKFWLIFNFNIYQVLGIWYDVGSTPYQTLCQ